MKEGRQPKSKALFERVVGGEFGVKVSGAYVVNIKDAQAYHFILTSDLLLSIVGAPALFQSHILTFHVVQGRNIPSSINWPTCIKWESSTPPTLSCRRGLRDMIQLETPDYGSTWHDTLIGIGYSTGDAV